MVVGADADRPSRREPETLTEPEVVPMTVEQHDQAVAALATMICDWLQTRAATAAAECPEGLNPPSRHQEGEHPDRPPR